MDEQSNIFLRILQIGVDRKGETICFNEMIAIINNEFKIPMKMIPSVRRWFYDYYYLPETFRMNKGLLNTLRNNDLAQYDDKQTFFTGDGFFKYYEYLEVKKAYQNAEAATKQASTALKWVKISLIIAASIGLVQILIMVFQTLTYICPK